MSKGVEKLNLLLGDFHNDIRGFSLELTDNGFILSLHVIYDSGQFSQRLEPIFSFEDTVKYEVVVDSIIKAIRVRKK
jgi:hypothetical protein